MASQNVQVLRKLDGGWLQCQDEQGVFFYNEVTRESCVDVPPALMMPAKASSYQPQSAVQAQMPQAAPVSQPTVKAQIGDWMICEDAQGEFYFNKVTQQAFDDVPAELRARLQAVQKPSQQVAAASPQVQVLRDLGGGWLQCQDDQGLYFFNEVTGESSVDVPAALRVQVQPTSYQPQSVAYAQQVSVSKPYQPYAQQASLPTPYQPQSVAYAQQASEPKLKEQIGDWMICEDAQGEFYVNARTQQSFDKPPAELVKLYQSIQQQKQSATQQSQAAAQQAAMQQQMRLQQQMQYQPQKQYANHVTSAAQYYQQQVQVR
jgi:hypothetical protein